METFKNLIGGEWVGASDHASFETRNPARSDEVLGTFPSATAADSAQAVAAAAEAFPGWRATPAPARGAILFRAAELLDERFDDIVATLTREEGKTLAEAKGEVTRARDILRYFGGEGWRLGGDVLPANTADAMLFSRREPLGVVAVITPWNFPIAIPAWKIAPALVYGDTVVFKPASATPLTALRLVAVQLWPVSEKPPVTTSRTARSRSASSRTTVGFLPPISSWTRAKCSVARA